MPKAPYLIYDNLHDRKEIFCHLLDRLHPDQRIDWLRWCCARSMVENSNPPIRPRIRRDTLDRAALARTDDSAAEKLSIEIWADFWALPPQYEFDADAGIAELVRRVRLIGRKDR